MRAHKPSMFLQPFESNAIVGCRDRFIEGLERDLCVNDDCAIAGEPHNHVGSDTSIFVSDGFLLGEIAVFKHPGKFDNATQLDLTPTPAHMRSAQSLYQISGFSLKL